MSVDALVLALVAIADMALIVALRRRRNRLVRQARMMGSLRLALRCANAGANGVRNATLLALWSEPVRR
jgi:hypothetical protein